MWCKLSLISTSGSAGGLLAGYGVQGGPAGLPGPPPQLLLLQLMPCSLVPCQESYGHQQDMPPVKTWTWHALLYTRLHCNPSFLGWQAVTLLRLLCRLRHPRAAGRAQPLARHLLQQGRQGASAVRHRAAAVAAVPRLPALPVQGRHDAGAAQ
jgi:hypothetical protein